MVRMPAGERLPEVAEAATRVFGRLGYRRTLMADVAREAGMSAGAIYTYVESKEALFALVFLHAFGHFAEGPPTLPLAAPEPAETLRLIGRGLARATAVPHLRAALEVDEPVGGIRAELTAVVTERYLGVERLWPILAVVERSAVDLPELDALYFQRGRRAYWAELERYLEKRAASGHLRTVPDVHVAGRIVTETIAWFAWHRREGREPELYEDEASRRTVIQFVCDALVAPGR
jgi:AcrR family transcriptional regulator